MSATDNRVLARLDRLEETLRGEIQTLDGRVRAVEVACGEIRTAQRQGQREDDTTDVRLRYLEKKSAQRDGERRAGLAGSAATAGGIVGIIEALKALWP